MAWDLIIQNGTVVDGTGSPGYRADVAVADGKIAAIGQVDGRARTTIDASELIVAPGFIDPHTHYDAQICWDPYLTPSSWHGVTTAVMGNCGVGIAPCQPERREMTVWDLVNVEAIPYDVLAAGIEWEWESFPEYIDAAARHPRAINVGFIAPLTPFRHFVMGEASTERAATREETARIKSILKEAVQSGAFGWSASLLPTHIGYKGRPLASRLVDESELKAYSNALKELGRGTIEIALTKAASVMDEAEYRILELLLAESGRPVSWLALMLRDDLPDAHLELLRRLEGLIERGAKPQSTCRPMVIDVDLRKPTVMAPLPSFEPIFNETTQRQMDIYRDPEFRASFSREFGSVGFFTKWERVTVLEAQSASSKRHEGRRMVDIALERATDPADTFLDLALEDDLQLIYQVDLFNGDESRMPEIIANPNVTIGLSDGGAHVDVLCDAGYCTYLIGKWVRERGALTLEHAVKRITAEPADLFGISQRGRLQAGLAADLAIFDFETVGSAARGEMVHDLPGGARRLVVKAHGVHYTIVNGKVVYDHGEPTGELPGQVLRSGSC
jgi:N-acyl-D-aspartate/D-glutamate deacylase